MGDTSGEPTTKTVYGTGFVQTTVESFAPDRARWTRVPGINNRDGLGIPPQHLGTTLAEIDTSPVDFVLPQSASQHEVTWKTDGAIAFGNVVRNEADSPLARDGITALATGLTAFHRDPPTMRALSIDDNVVPPGLLRFCAWTDTGDGPRASRPWRVRLRGALGQRRWNLLREFAQHLRTLCSAHSADVHGWMSLGNIAASTGRPGTPPHLQVLTGTDVGRGPRELDVSCLLGELAEFSFRAEHFDLDSLPFEHLAHMFVASYGHELDAELLAMGKAIRVALHSSDFASFVGWSEDLDLYPDMVAELVDTVGV
ncbi:hypothetical protein ACNHUS_30930 [Actinomycetes bacterium M1A6_2h]